MQGMFITALQIWVHWRARVQKHFHIPSIKHTNTHTHSQLSSSITKHVQLPNWTSTAKQSDNWMGRKIDAKLFNLILITTECSVFIESQVFSLLVNSFNIHGLASLWVCHWMERPPVAWRVFFPHFSCLAWICHMQAGCLYRCLKQKVTDGPVYSVSLDVTFFSGSSIILLHCQVTGRPLQADLLNCEGI